MECEETFSISPIHACPRCGSDLELRYDLQGLKKVLSRRMLETRHGEIWKRYAELLPSGQECGEVSLGEGSSPLIKSPRLGPCLGLKDLRFKLEYCNPTGSFKDRQMSVSMTMQRLFGRRTVALASSGNAGVSAAAYSAAAGMTCHVWVSETTPQAKLTQMLAYGARVYMLSESADPEQQRKAYYSMRDLCESRGWGVVVTARRVCPYAIEGAKTIAYEICQQLDWQAPDVVFAPVGGGGCVVSTWKGFREFRALEFINNLPTVYGVQPDTSFPIAELCEITTTSDKFIPLDGRSAYKCIVESGGSPIKATREEIATAQKMLAELDGIYAEPQGAHALAGLIQATKGHLIPSGSIVVCYITGIGLKDTIGWQHLTDQGIADNRLIKVDSLEF